MTTSAFNRFFCSESGKEISFYEVLIYNFHHENTNDSSITASDPVISKVGFARFEAEIAFHEDLYTAVNLTDSGLRRNLLDLAINGLINKLYRV